MAKVIRYTKYGYEIYDTETMSYKMLDGSYIYVSDFDNGFAKVTIKEGSINKYGYIDESGKEVVPTIYDEISEVYKGCMFARKHDGYYSKYRNEWYKQHYSKEEHRKVLVRHIHNELKNRAITEEIKKWIEPYRDLLN